MPSTVVFDLGGVVLNWQPAVLLRQCLAERLGSDLQASALAEMFFESFRPGGAWAEFDRGSLSIDAVARRIADGATGLSRAEVDRVMEAIPAHLQVRADSAVLIGELHAAGHRLLFLSNMPTPYVDYVQRQLDLLGVFEGGIYSSDVGLVKPEIEIYQLAMRRFACAPNDLVFFDDNAVNVDAALRLDWQARVFVDAAGARRDLAGLGLLPTATAGMQL
jgi:putative hydrolase of the HAD superfamily